ncbi:uncharacterized protein BJ212DRAFT_1477420 [Suillus subaureus]|uniref:Uncharacterized protein n=1 Tax=Suillus subaureus TaxID=48587 RepID=A0A9P7EHS8_9AGAM|nr:uncharacterized protein BJ212DRAFT_1477420 [Suillus subaureus]KAG1821542.1 hypothetical protein BJ212DRAFT_1477420 [Suillus subaureus]
MHHAVKVHPRTNAPCKSSTAHALFDSPSPKPSQSPFDADANSERGETYFPAAMDSEMDLEGPNFGNRSELCNLSRPALPSRRVPRSFHDIEHPVKDLNGSDNTADVPRPSLPHRSRIQQVILTLQDAIQTVSNLFGLSRLYPRHPSFEPDKFIPSTLLARTCPMAVQEMDSPGLPDVLPLPYPFLNMTIYWLVSWMNSGSHRKSEAEVQRLITDVLQADDFDIKDLEGFSLRKSLWKLDKDDSRERITFPDDWVETDITINIPTKSTEEGPIAYTIHGFHYCPLVEVIHAAFADVQAHAFHLSPFKWLWQDPLDSHQE